MNTESKKSHNAGDRERALFPGTELIGAVPLSGLLLMVVNDHWLRIRWPCWLTGKLSDFGVVLYFPFLITATARLVLYGISVPVRRITRGRIQIDYRLTRPKLAGAILITGACLAGINLVPSLRDLYVALLTRLDVFDIWGRFQYTMDPSDCLALLLLPVAWFWGKRYTAR